MFFIIEEAQLDQLKRLAARLYSERRMDGNEMRDAAQLLDAIERVCRQMPLPEAP